MQAAAGQPPATRIAYLELEDPEDADVIGGEAVFAGDRAVGGDHFRRLRAQQREESVFCLCSAGTGEARASGSVCWCWASDGRRGCLKPPSTIRRIASCAGDQPLETGPRPRQSGQTSFSPSIVRVRCRIRSRGCRGMGWSVTRVVPVWKKSRPGEILGPLTAAEKFHDGFESERNHLPRELHGGRPDHAAGDISYPGAAPIDRHQQHLFLPAPRFQGPIRAGGGGLIDGIDEINLRLPLPAGVPWRPARLLPIPGWPRDRRAGGRSRHTFVGYPSHRSRIPAETPDCAAHPP